MGNDLEFNTVRLIGLILSLVIIIIGIFFVIGIFVTICSVTNVLDSLFQP